MATHRKQHYVPQCYLRRFADAAGNLVCFDKAHLRSHPTTTLAAAQEKHFYDVPAEVELPAGADRQMAEKLLSEIESHFGPLIDRLVASAVDGRIAHEQIAEFSPFVALQWMRTRTYRDVAYEVTQKGGQALVDRLVEANFPGESCKLKFVPEQMALVHTAEMLDPQRLRQMGHELDRHIWVIGINESNHPFYTSDHPVVRRGNYQCDGLEMVGIADPGIEFSFPLSSQHVLLIMERRHFAAWTKHDARAVKLTVEQVRDYNQIQVMRSSRRLYCREDDFDLAREVCERHPIIRDPNRPRIKVEMTPIRDMQNRLNVTTLE
jgi:hypothetical protein